MMMMMMMMMMSAAEASQRSTDVRIVFPAAQCGHTFDWYSDEGRGRDWASVPTVTVH